LQGGAQAPQPSWWVQEDTARNTSGRRITIEVPIPTGLNLHDFQDFRKLLTPELIKIVYYLGLIAVAAVSLVSIWASFIVQEPLRTVFFIGGIIYFGVGFLGLRLGCESIIVVFKILDELVAINQKLVPSGTDRRTDG
jgi:hypothetical protein